MPRESKSHVGEGFRRMKPRKKGQKPSSFYRAPEVQERGKSLDSDSNVESIGLGISTSDEKKTPDKPSKEWSGEEMAEDPKIQDYSSRRPPVLVRCTTPKPRQTVLPRYGDPVLAVQELLLFGGALIPVGREGEGLLMRVSTDQVRAVRETRRREREGTSNAGRAAIGIMHEPCYPRDSWLTLERSQRKRSTIEN
jgi:hypothetical protein